MFSDITLIIWSKLSDYLRTPGVNGLMMEVRYHKIGSDALAG